MLYHIHGLLHRRKSGSSLHWCVFQSCWDRLQEGMCSAATHQQTDESSLGQPHWTSNFQFCRNICENRCIRWIKSMLALMLAFRTTKEKLQPCITTRRNSLLTVCLPVSGTLPPLFVNVRWLLRHYLVESVLKIDNIFPHTNTCMNM